ncbi:hypothetical protein MMC13_002862 [Lambiella insularis]|nr:hypothetical protein [Lambiella insularis]
MAASPPGKRIVFTGGSGKAGRHVIPYLLSRGHQILNLDLVPLAHPAVHTLKTDLTDSGQVYNALSSLFSMSEYALSPPPPPPDAVIHFAAYARNMLVPDSECFRGNVLSTYNVIEAACRLGVRKIVIASSETVYGVCFAQGDADYHAFPLEEDYDADPMDTYATSKLCGERTARSFARRFGVDIYALRIGNVVEPHEYAADFPAYLASPATRKRNAWSYVDARDLGQICDLCVGKSGLGFQVFNATNDTITTRVPTRAFLREACPGVRVTREMGEWEAPLSNRKIREVLGFRDVHDWRKYVEGEGEGEGEGKVEES